MNMSSASLSASESTGFFGAYGGQFVPDDLKARLDEVTEAFDRYRDNSFFKDELDYYFKHYTGRPNPIFFCANLSERLGGAKIYLKREDLNHLGAHKINNTLGQCLLAKRMGKKRIVAETGAGQHGVATAATAALLGLECTVYMGAEDMKRQRLNVIRMEMLGAKVVPALSGQRTLKEAVDEALAAWIANPDTFYVLGSAVGPHPYPTMVRHFQSVIGCEAREQMLAECGKLPVAAFACVGGGSNAIGIFTDFIKEKDVRLIGVEPGGLGIETGEHGAPLGHGQEGIFFGARSFNMQTPDGQIKESYSISAGLDFPSVGPEHAYLQSIGRAQYVNATDEEALLAFRDLCLHEGIIPALESSHALAHALRMIRENPDKEQIILCNLSGRGDKDVNQVLDRFERIGLFKDGHMNREAYINATTL